MIKLLLADDQAIFRKGLSSLLSLEDDIEVIGEANHGGEAIALAAAQQPDIILMDVRMPICDGVQATKEIHARYPWIRILVFTTFDDDEYVFQSLQAGALGYLLKSTPSREVAEAIRNLQRGYSQLGPTIAPKVFSQINADTERERTDYRNQFSERELDILKQLGQGKRNREIAANLNLTEGTIKNHLTNIFCQLDVRDRTQAALWAHQHLLS
ncbi:response regulator transcription factor [cf. Phormidesmis sp. LEGE 11477]|uniref:response regulator n=1 Tax=cf. Phormidesmis sp. LEGE 11477 TaxID=1828680 RepID=UPI00187FC47E|nr:response regulator transcription factor [cf. Phormidesmis sp. LEGE 11477]MBE9063165.1 response regulator transcription factor [cf. Phormidesmis sp. LEGE 11477]